ncbi:Alcohol dehydrogenase superfamily, zinc-type [Akanthomyces lecanii RCEF 1005]|uniref:Alcohol dehydrogenase superfamily, zinc-type n=1 Tax=Akanthomyces lecanii RCEF 1005 TaxID=1081108 RepID=A0A162KUY9_CORDF|nr:Alcohol dehydrogenase superfamily, zinc-type [Akanthomyces lecanii RCEF 1005]
MPTQLPAKMKAIQVKEFNKPYELSEIDVPTPKPHQVLVKIQAGGFCHTDCMVMENAFDSPLPVVASHEPAGVVVSVGADVAEFKKGDRVGCINFDSCCGECPDCEGGRPIYCDKPSMKGINVNGAWSEYMVADARFTVKLPESINFSTAACLMCAGITIYGSIKRANVPSGGSIAIVGIGGLGHIGTQLAKAMGYKVVAVDVKQSSLDLVNSYRWKPDVGVLATEPADDAVCKITTVVEGAYPGVDAAILATDAPPAFDFAAAITKKHGTLVLVGQPDKGITLSYFNVIFRDLKLVGSLIADKKQAEELVALVAEAGIQVQIKEWRPEQAEEMRKEYLTGKGDGKNVIVFA